MDLIDAEWSRMFIAVRVSFCYPTLCLIVCIEIKAVFYFFVFFLHVVLCCLVVYKGKNIKCCNNMNYYMYHMISHLYY
jgi:hypothetical protein